MKYSRRSPKLTMIWPLGNCGLKRTTSRPLPSTMLPPPQSQSNCADAGATWKQPAAKTAPAARAARRSARPMIISQLLVFFALSLKLGDPYCATHVKGAFKIVELNHPHRQLGVQAGPLRKL